MEVLDISLKITDILLPIIVMTMLFIMMEVFECLWVTEDVDLGLNRSAILPLAIMEFIAVVIKVATM